MQINIQPISIEQALPVRHQVLWPSKPVEFCRVEGDDGARHYGAFASGQLVCVASIYICQDVARLRKFATLADFQGQGIGSAMLKHILGQLRQQGVACFWCDARETALGLYRRFGMQSEGERFYKSEVAYFKMALDLAAK